ncbi:Transcription factor, partial [Penicillium capsulatum]
TQLLIIASRTSKTRCDGRNPCSTCVANQRHCHYRPSRRGGARRGERYENAKRQRTGAIHNPPSSPLSFDQSHSNRMVPLVRNVINTHSLTDSIVDGIVGLIHSFDNIQDARDFENSSLESGLGTSTGIPTPGDSPRSWMIRSYRNESDL